MEESQNNNNEQQNQNQNEYYAHIIEKATPYKPLIMSFANIFLWKKIKHLFFYVFLIDVIILYAHCFELGMFSFVFYIATIIYVFGIVFSKLPLLAIAYLPLR